MNLRLAFAVLLALPPSTALAYTVETPADPGCHESITTVALRQVRTERPPAAAITPTDDEAALIDDLQFIPEVDLADLGGATLLMAVRDNDLKGRGSADLNHLPEIHGNPESQREHCLRSPDQVEPDGSAAALTACRAFIATRFGEALDGLDAAGNVDRNNTVILTVHGELRGTMDATLPTYYVRMGQAIHTLQDAFTHTYRTPDQVQPTVVLNWIAYATDSLDEAVDGPAHHADLDRCDDPSPIHIRRRELATQATIEVLRTSLTSTLTRAQKVAALDATLDHYLGLSAGCTAANAWCNAPEAALPIASGCACVTGVPRSPLLLLGLGLALVVGLRRRSPLHARALAVIAGAAVALVPLAASADDVPTFRSGQATVGGTADPAAAPAAPADARTGTTTAGKPTTDDEGTPLTPAERAALPPPPKKPVAEPGSHDPEDVDFRLYLGASGSYDEPALAATLGLRMQLTKHWSLGLDGEWNPWIALNTSGIRAGSANLYLSAIFRLPLAYEDFNVRSAVSIGGSYLLTDLYGAPAGSVGVYLGVAPLGLEWKLSKAFYLIINPLNIATPIPHLTGVPLAYAQYRLTIGLEYDL